MSITITEALADLKTIEKRIARKKESVLAYMARHDQLKDPLAKDGGSEKFVNSEMQGIKDLCKRIVDIRVAVQRANLDHRLTVCEITRSIAEWLAWRRDAANHEKGVLDSIFMQIQHFREQARTKNLSILSPGDTAQTGNDLFIFVNEKEIALDRERHEEILGVLDGKLSLANATIQIEI